MSNERINALVRELRQEAQTLSPGKRRDINNKLDRVVLALRQNDIPDESATVIDNQRKMVQEYLLAGNTITALEAIRKFGILDLAGVIKDIERATGKAPNRRRIKVTNRYGKHTSVCEYWIEQETN